MGTPAVGAPVVGTPVVGAPEVGEERGLSGHKLPALIEVVTGDIPREIEKEIEGIYLNWFQNYKGWSPNTPTIYFKIAPYKKTEGYYDRLKIPMKHFPF